MSPHQENEVIVFDNLVRPTDVVGAFAKIKAKAEPFVNSNAAGDLRQANKLDDIRSCAEKSGKSLLALLAS